MEAENGVLPDCGNGGIAEKTLCVGGLGLDSAKEKENVDLAVDLLEINGISKDPSNAEEINSSNAEDETTAVVSDNKRSNDSSKKSGIEPVKNVKSAKNQAVHKAPSMFSRNQRSGLSQSLSLPSKKIVTHTLRSSNTTINARPNGTEPVSPVSNGSLTSTSRSNSFIKSFASGMTSNSDANKGGVSSNRSTLTPGLTTRHSLPGKNGSLNTSSNGSASKISQPCEHDQKPSGGAFPIKDDDDAHSTTSSTTSRNQRRNSGGSTFASRLDERAQKRKVFFTKLEEKIQAKEDEKNDIQAKSKENQEEEIKQLRKNLAFKATPMPTFYQEPGPPKVELKKIPTTRPKSPKLGRNKSSAAVTESSDRQRRSSYPSLDLIKPNGGTTNRNGDSSTLKKPIRRSLVKPPSQKPTATKAEAKSRNSKPKTTNSDEKMCNGESSENPLMSSDVLFPATETATAELESIQDTEEDETILDLPDPVLTSNEVSVMG